MRITKPLKTLRTGYPMTTLEVLHRFPMILWIKSNKEFYAVLHCITSFGQQQTTYTTVVSHGYNGAEKIPIA